MAEGKWIGNLEPSMLVAEAARRALGVRLEVVGSFLGLALTEADRDPEHVHQLRVGTRRAVAALETFAPCLPERVYRRARRRLRRLRRAAGAARDWDVFLATLTVRERRAARRPGADFLLGYTLGRRADAQEQLCDAGKAVFERFARFRDRVADAVRDPGPGCQAETLLDLARPMLSALAQELHEAAAHDLADYACLHRVRIAGKRLRYAMELFADCFASAFREELYPRVEEMQDILGRANDSHEAGILLEEVRDKLRTARPRDWRRFKPEVEALLRYHRRRLPQERKRFLAWWAAWQGSDAEGQFAALLRNGS